jgi:glutamate synthase (NADPH/NADH) small chain
VAEPARLGHHVTLFEFLHEAGGVLVNGIPAFRFPQEIVKAEINTILYKGVDLRLNHLVGRSITVDELPAPMRYL